MTNEQKRIGWIDEFKGFVLLLVCLYHVEQSFPQAQMGMLHLSALRMSAFFFISGMLFSTRRFPDFKSYLVHKTRVLLVPYILLSLLFLAIDPVLYNFDLFPKAPRMTVMNIKPEIATVWDYIYWNLAKIFVAGKSSIGSGPLWFVFTLYSVSLLFYGVQCAARKISEILSPLRGSRMTAGVTALAAIASLAGGWFLYVNHIRLPLGIERDLTVLFFFANGWLCKGALKDPRLGSATLTTGRGDDVRGKNILAIVAATIVAFAAYAYLEIPDPNFSIMNNDLGKSLPVFLASSFFGIAGLVATFMFADKLPNIAPFRIIKGILRNISRNALVILAVHWYTLLVMRLLFRDTFNKPGIAYLVIPVVAAVVIVAIPLFRCKLYRLLGKQKISVRESLNIKD
ncbi:acyltransferase [Fibrobacter sp.]|uniref:acyltransferase family protein n=1 Tax=Fibrobacter sp. TaxID=35828 RepID=UPI0025C4D3AB|nr:acyltransferase [Fibrobacter sp.]MBR2058174.1 acyltransferase [Fibrobacter sp.]MBR2306907.1 acyltransferase [Fibrobacter sp.]MBR4006528.1 acyltransferase [Fibrobacter sp.]